MKEIEKKIGKSISGKLMCPLGCNDNDQEMFTMGDEENRLFCPHCDFSFEIVIIYNPENEEHEKGK